MKSTGLFGKNSGRVGGVVYSNYRGEQIVRSYQPQVKNPNSPLQVAQRAKFKLVSQVGAVLGKELQSYEPSKKNETSRNAWLRAMLKNTVYNKLQSQASLSVEDIVLTSSKLNIFDLNMGVLEITPEQVSLGIIPEDWQDGTAKFHIVEVGWNEGGDMEITMSRDENISRGNIDINILTINRERYRYLNVLVFAYRPKAGATRVSYADYDMSTTEATLQEMQSMYGGDLEYTRTLNFAIPSEV